VDIEGVKVGMFVRVQGFTVDLVELNGLVARVTSIVHNVAYDDDCKINVVYLHNNKRDAFGSHCLEPASSLEVVAATAKSETANG
jgi:hypothetical protein